MTRAAKRLHIAQPALSQAIAALESDLGLKLLDRHARGVSLTRAGEVFYEKARLAVAATEDAMQTARSLARAQAGTIEFGFLGAPPGIDSPGPLEAFGLAYPEIDICYRELKFPPSSTSSWLAQVDLAVCHSPPPDPAVSRRVLRREPRVVLAPRRHPLAGRSEVGLEEAMEETFISISSDVDPAWAGFWSLDDHRGGPPARLTADRAASPEETIAALSMRSAITTAPAAAARVIGGLFKDVTAVPLLGAEPSQVELVGHADVVNPVVAALTGFAEALAGASDPL